MKSILGYGRYDDDPTHVGCPRAQSDMTPCIARDGRTALDDDRFSRSAECVGCGKQPLPLYRELALASGDFVSVAPNPDLEVRDGAEAVADALRDLVLKATEPCV